MYMSIFNIANTSSISFCTIQYTKKQFTSTMYLLIFSVYYQLLLLLTELNVFSVLNAPLIYYIRWSCLQTIQFNLDQLVKDFVFLPSVYISYILSSVLLLVFEVHLFSILSSCSLDTFDLHIILFHFRIAFPFSSFTLYSLYNVSSTSIHFKLCKHVTRKPQ